LLTIDTQTLHVESIAHYQILQKKVIYYDESSINKVI